MGKQYTRTVSIIFDDSYVEPAIVTAHQILRQDAIFDRLILVYIATSYVEPQAFKNDPKHREPKNPPTIETSQAELAEYIMAFVRSYQNNKYNVDAVALTSSSFIDQFSFAHFNSSIIKKLFIPKVISNAEKSEIIINLDAGFTAGSNSKVVLETIFRSMENSKYLVGAFCNDFTDASQDYSEICTRLSFNHHEDPTRMYPAGTLLAFNSRNCYEEKFSERVALNLTKNLGSLRMAEQELLLLTLHSSEVLNLYELFTNGEDLNPFKVYFLSTNGALSNTHLDALKIINSRNFGFFKIIGSLKPWHKDIYDAIKIEYLQACVSLYKEFPQLNPDSFAGFRKINHSLAQKLNLTSLNKIRLEINFYNDYLSKL